MPAMPAALDSEIECINRNGAVVELSADFLPPHEADRACSALMAELVFNTDEESRVRVRGRWYAIPRRQTAYGDAGTQYRFSGCTVPARPWTPELASLRALVHERTGFDANFVLANHYRDENDCIGWHSDDEAGLGPKPEIVSLSLGAVRDFQLRRRDARVSGIRTVTVSLPHGSLLVLSDPTNKLWLHQLPRRGGANRGRIAPRLNLTWRQMRAGV